MEHVNPHEKIRDSVNTISAKVDGSEGNVQDMRRVPEKVEKLEVKKEGTSPMDTTGDVNMEANISSDDVVRAGGFGARDDIGSFLPIATDSTDFEASLRDARDYEEPQGKINRPGLGWTEPVESVEH